MIHSAFVFRSVFGALKLSERPTLAELDAVMADCKWLGGGLVIPYYR